MAEGTTQRGFGVDVGGSGIKGAVVDLKTGEFIGERYKIATPKPATPEAVAEVISEIVEHFAWTGPIGITLPAIVRAGRVDLAANIDKSWIGVDTARLFDRFFPSRPLLVLNDADAAGLAEVEFGQPAAARGNVIFLTFGTGIGSAFLTNGHLFANTELGHLMYKGKDAEVRASSAAKDRDELSYKAWARKRVNPLMKEYERIFNPDSFIVGGGISRQFDKWGPYLELETPVYPAELRNRAGIVGAALAVERSLNA